MFGVSVCSDFVLVLALQPSTSMGTTYRSSSASPLYNLSCKGILFSFLYSLLLLMSILSGPNWHNTTKQHNPHNKNLPPQIWNLHYHATSMKYSEWRYSTSDVSPRVVGRKHEKVKSEEKQFLECWIEGRYFIEQFNAQLQVCSLQLF